MPSGWVARVYWKNNPLRGEEVGTYNEFSAYQAILVRDDIPLEEREKVKIIPEFKK